MAFQFTMGNGQKFPMTQVQYAPVQDTQPYEEDYSTPPPPAKLSYSLSHADECLLMAMQYKDRCAEGDTVLMNYYVSSNNYVTLTYLKKTNGQMVTHSLEGRKKDIVADWTYDSCAFKYNDKY